MTNRNTRRALLASLMALILCVSSLLGTTYAWFTDSVTSNNNVITSGNLDVELYYKNSETTGFAKVDANTNVFKADTLWEPGHVEVITLKVVNEGTLALKYQLGINIAEEIGSTNMAGTEFKLSDFIMFGVVDGEKTFTREEAIAAVKDTATKINEKYNSGTKALYPADTQNASEEIVTLVVYMPSTVDNDANPAKGAATPTINLGIKVLATQYTAENDTFGPEYDAGAEFVDKAYTVAGNASIKDVLDTINTAEDKNVLIQLDEDIEWETGSGTGTTPWVDENAKVENLIIDANGATVTATGAGVGSIRMANGGTLTFKNAKIVDESVSYAENSWEFGYLEFAGNLVFENVEFVNAITIDGESAIFKDCTFNSNKDNEYAVWVSNGTASFTRCTFSGARGLKTHEAYGSEVVSITVDNCTFDNLTKKPGMAIGTVNAATTIIIKNSDFINCQPGDQSKYIYESDTDVTTFTFDCSENNTVVSETKVNVTNATELKTALTNAGSAGAGNSLITFSGDPIDMTGESWTPIKVDGYHGADIVVIDGNGTVITGLTAPLFAGGFAGGSGIVIKNLTIADSNIVSTNTIGSGAFIESVDSMNVITLDNCHLINSTVTGGSGSRTGGLIGWTAGYSNVNDGPVKTYVTIKNCSVVGNTITCDGSVGGIYGHAGNNDWTYSTVENCVVKNNILSSTDDGGWRVGVVVGTANVGEMTISEITEFGNTLTQTGKTAPAGQSNLYGRFVPGTTGTLTIDGVAVQ